MENAGSVGPVEMPPKVLHAFQVYLTNHKVEETARIVGVNRSTIYRWKRKYRWDDLVAEKQREILGSIEEYVTELKEEQRKILADAVKVAVQQLKEGKLRARSLSDLVALLRYQLELEGEFRNETNVSVNVAVSIAALHEELKKRRAEALHEDGQMAKKEHEFEI